MSAPRKPRKSSDVPVVGWREWVVFPQLATARLFSTRAKVDTGARTSALHADELEFFERGGRRWVRFIVHPEQRTNRIAVRCEAPLLTRRNVRSSTGVVTHRPVIETLIELGGERFAIELTLINRDSMGYRMLLGRTALHKRFVVDVARSYVQSREIENERQQKKRARKAKLLAAKKKPARKAARSV